MIHETNASSSPGGEDLLVVAHAGDELREFCTILFREAGRSPSLLVCAEGRTTRRHYLDEWLAEGTLGRVVISELARDGALDFNKLSAFIAAHFPQGIKSVWTHNPADDHRQRGQVALAVSRLLSDELVFYAHGVLNDYQFVADVCRPLTPAQIDRKISALNAGYADQLQYQPRTAAPEIVTRSILSVERFVRLSRTEVETLYALRHSMDAEASIAEDPWSFSVSAYERERLAVTTQWIRDWTDPERNSVIEVGACEGHLTRRLDAGGFKHLVACEPNERFRARLERRLRGTGIKVASFDLTGLADTGALPADCYLLIEMLYYLNDLSVLDRLPTKSLMIAVDDEYRFGPMQPWLTTTTTWRVVDERPLVGARIEFCAGNKAYRRKGGSRGLLLVRAETSAQR